MQPEKYCCNHFKRSSSSGRRSSRRRFRLRTLITQAEKCEANITPQASLSLVPEGKVYLLLDEQS